MSLCPKPFSNNTIMWKSVPPTGSFLNSFLYEMFYARIRFETETQGSSEMVHYYSCYINLGLVHITWEKFGNAASFVRFGLPSTLIRRENRAFSKMLVKLEEFENAGFLFSCRRSLETFFWAKLFEKVYFTISRDFPALVFFKSKMAGDCCVFKFPRCSMEGKHLISFQNENAVFKFLRHSIDEA